MTKMTTTTTTTTTTTSTTRDDDDEKATTAAEEECDGDARLARGGEASAAADDEDADAAGMSDEALMSSLVAMENHAFDPASYLLNRAQFNELLDLQTESEPDFMEDIVNMYCDDSQSMLEELRELVKTEGACTTEEMDKARATLHKLRGASSTLGAEGIQHTCEAMRESIVNEQHEALRRGPGSIEELEDRLKELKKVLKRYVAVSRECVVRKLSRR